MKVVSEIRFNSLQSLAAASLRGGGREYQMYCDALEKKEKKIDQMYDLLTSGEIDGFVQKDEKNEKTGRFLMHTWTRSTRWNATIQKTTWLCDEEGYVIPLSHHDIVVAGDMYTEAAPHAGKVEGWRC